MTPINNNYMSNLLYLMKNLSINLALIKFAAKYNTRLRVFFHPNVKNLILAL